jgi:type II secretory pathway pseudopilin PulG
MKVHGGMRGAFTLFELLIVLLIVCCLGLAVSSLAASVRQRVQRGAVSVQAATGRAVQECREVGF